MRHSPLIAGALLALCGIAPGVATATDLLQVWQAARQHDPQGQVIEAARAAGSARREQAAALWRPTLGLTASAGYSSADSRMEGAQFAAPGFGNSIGVSFGTSVEGGTATRWSLGARQPLYHPERRAQQRQLSLAADAADLESQAAQQDWMLLTAQRYFDLLLAERRLALLQQQRAAVDRAYTEAQDRYALGDQPITDSHEAAARARGLQAQLLAAANEFELARQALQDSTGLAAEGLQLQAPAGQVADGQLAGLDAWLALLQQHNPLLRLQQAQVEVAAAEVRKHGLAGSAMLELVAQASRERLGGSGNYGTASNSQSQQMVGLALNLPLYTGGWRSAKLAEALSLEQKAKAELDRARLQLAQQTRASWLALDSGQARLAALDQALLASRARLDATRLGRQVGDRTTLDLLNAENDAAAAELALLQARTELLQNRLRLEALAGQLDLQGLQAVNAKLQP